ncbi:MAG: hypothetical protein MZV49_24380 [Rhodopseudomonas palustris]|nr:hypothetical protein [Rhodopseudomonas palustris]
MSRIGTDKEISLESTIKDHDKMTSTEKKVLLDLLHAGEIGALRVQESIGRSFMDIRMSTKGIGKFLPSELFGILSEKSNRLHSALHGVRDLQEREPGTERRCIRSPSTSSASADFPYSKATRQKVAQGPIGSSMFVFKSYLRLHVRTHAISTRTTRIAVAAAGMFAALAGAARGSPATNSFASASSSSCPARTTPRRNKT